MNLRSQKGATGTDIIISITIIVLTVAVVSMIYVNTTLQSRNVTRTAGATRIAVNILENIEKTNYDTVASTYTSNGSPVSTGNYAGYKSYTDTTIFNTKIPKGYIVYLKADPVYGGHSDAAEKFDLVREIKLSVTFDVGKVNQTVDFSTSKVREIVGEVNAPNTDILALKSNGEDVLTNTLKNFYPIKYSEDASAYVKTTEDDIDWYNYSAKKWAMILVSGKTETEVFDINGKLKSSLTEGTDYKRYVWVPRYFTDSTGATFSQFCYLTTTDQAIKANTLSSVDGTSASLTYNTYASVSGLAIPTHFRSSGTGSTGQEVPGYWVITSKVTSDAPAKILNSSSYGPCEIH